MGTTKRHIYREDLLILADFFKALGHPARLQILEEIAKSKEVNGKVLNEKIALAQSTISKHVKELYLQGIIGHRSEGKSTYYRINPIVVNQGFEYISEFYEHMSLEQRKVLNLYFFPRGQPAKLNFLSAC